MILMNKLVSDVLVADASSFRMHFLVVSVVTRFSAVLLQSLSLRSAILNVNAGTATESHPTNALLQRHHAASILVTGLTAFFVIHNQYAVFGFKIWNFRKNRDDNARGTS